MSDAARPVVLVTGAGRGIGRVLARRYAAAGYGVALAGRQQATLDATAEIVRAEGAPAVVVVGDVRDEDSCGELVERTLSGLGRLDVLLNNAAVPGRDQAVADMDLANWNDVIATNVTGPMLLSREALRRAMLPARSGNIQYFSSAAAKAVLPRKAHYATAKLALIPLAQTLAAEVGPQGVRVNTLVIGTVDGELVDAYAERIAGERGVTADEIKAGLARDAALARLVQPEEVAEVSLWLASDAASAITGQDLNVTAGGEKR
jgi:glucose 1-dehydrogenase